MTQTDTFFRTEGDAWFARNRHALTPEGLWDRDLVLQLLLRVSIHPTAVLEVGAANGYRLAALAERFGCSATALEPSAEAIRHGRRTFPAVQFVRGLAHDMASFPDASFDLVIVNFVLHWVERSCLLRTVAEIDRVLANQGYLVIGDFFPATAHKVQYHHLPDGGVWTYKQDYAQLWLSSNLYQDVAALVYNHDTHAVTSDIDLAHRAKLTVLRRNLDGHYAARLHP